MPIAVTNIEHQPRIDVRAVDAESGAAKRLTTYRGTVRLELVREGRVEIAHVGLGNHVALWLPDSLPYTSGTQALITATVLPTLQRVSGGASTADGPYGVHSVTAALADDPRGSGYSYVSLGFVHTYATDGAEAAYEVVVVTDL